MHIGCRDHETLDPAAIFFFFPSFSFQGVEISWPVLLVKAETSKGKHRSPLEDPNISHSAFSFINCYINWNLTALKYEVFCR